mmetsp:Transcript_15225/g.38127  ORF Transcript_15225/g.38127 Transcript_15225/m.38127 type:complete len:241 (+) Transcript_15225:3572-4294(+)
MSSRSSHSSACLFASFGSMPLMLAKSCTCCITLSSPKSRSCCGHTPEMARILSIDSTTSCPSTTAFPLVGFTSPHSMLIAVDFPAPFWPSSPVTSPSSISKDRSFTACTGDGLDGYVLYSDSTLTEAPFGWRRRLPRESFVTISGGNRSAPPHHRGRQKFHGLRSPAAPGGGITWSRYHASNEYSTTSKSWNAQIAISGNSPSVTELSPLPSFSAWMNRETPSGAAATETMHEAQKKPGG